MVSLAIFFEERDEAAVVGEDTEVVVLVVAAEIPIILYELGAGPESRIESVFFSFQEKESIGGQLEVADFHIVGREDELAISFLHQEGEPDEVFLQLGVHVRETLVYEDHMVIDDLQAG